MNEIYIKYKEKKKQDKIIAKRQKAIAKAKTKIKKPKTKKPKKENRKKIIKNLDNIFSKYIRLKNSINGKCECYTCGTVDYWHNIQNGHFITRGCYALRRDETNCKPQCIACNIFRNGNYIEYTTRMVKEYGMDFVDNLKNQKNKIVKFSTPELKEKIEFYQKKVNILLNILLNI